MRDTVLRVPVSCPRCAQEWLMEFPAKVVADALESGAAIRLFASCHATVWNASFVERQQLGEYLEATRLSRSTTRSGELNCAHF
jgi:hypothetical protein